MDGFMQAARLQMMDLEGGASQGKFFLHADGKNVYLSSILLSLDIALVSGSWGERNRRYPIMIKTSVTLWRTYMLLLLVQRK